MSPAGLDEKEACLKKRLGELGSLLVAFSGGVDSTLLLSLAHEVLGDKARAVIGTAPFYPRRETDEAILFCQEEAIAYETLFNQALSLPAFRRGAHDRCYYCKKNLLGHAVKLAEKRGLAHVADGSNADDESDYRPGVRALEEAGVVSPLAECGLTKADVRALSKKRGLSTWDKPARACLATRLPYGVAVTERDLVRIEACEEALFAEGFRQVRVRMHSDVARIEVGQGEIGRLVSAPLRKRIDEALRDQGFLYVAVDLRGYRTGSLNEGIDDDG